MATLLTKKSDTSSSVPLAADLTNAAGGAELAVNTADKRLYTKTSGGSVVELGTNPSSLALPSGTANGVAYLNGSKVLTTGSALTFDGTTFATTGFGRFGNGGRIEGTGSALAGTGVGAEIFASGNIAYYTSYDRTGAAYSPLISIAGSYQAWNVSGEQMRLTSTGLGIGTSSPTAKLDIQGGNIVVGTNTAGNSTASMTFGKVAAGGGTISNRISLATYGGAYGAYMEAYADLNASTATYLAFGTQAGGGGTPTERMRLDSSGNLLVGTTGAGGAKVNILGNGGTKGLSVNPDAAAKTTIEMISLSNDTSTAGMYLYSTVNSEFNFRVWSNGNVQNTNNSYGAISDIKLKENIVEATPKLEKMQQVRVVNYNLIGEDQKQIGVIAQELEQIFPGMIDESPDRDKDGNDLGTTTKSVKYSVFVPMLIKAIQEQQALIDAQQAALQTLTARVEALESN
jgi:hypothetical protein